MRVRAVWDPAKARANRFKHGVEFADAEGVLFDPLAVTREDVTSSVDRRFLTVGTDYRGKVIVVVYIIGDPPRIISARRATRRERNQYEERV